ncbi:MAG: tetratricopeptide repeat protein, partial [bacterium]|nr:tetratricopeptide repeat protein [bacterium]
MARKIRFPLNMKDGAAVRTIEELQEHFDLESVLGYFTDGKLITWLERAYYDDKARAVGQLDAEMPDLAEKLCEILGVEYKADAEAVDIEAIQKHKEKLRLLSSLTADQEILDNADRVAMNQEELMELLANPPETIYLFSGEFAIPFSKKNIRYIGVNLPKVTLGRGKLIADYQTAGITFKDVQYNSPYYTEAEQLYLADKYAEALPLLEEAAGQGNPRAMYLAALCYRYGFGTLCNYDKSREWLLRASGMKDPLSSVCYAEWYCYDDKCKKSQILPGFTKELRELAFSGDCLAQYEYYNYVLSYNVVQDHTKAIEWLRKAAEQGNARAQNTLGLTYNNGQGVEQDYNKAVEWYRKAAEQGNIMAQFNLGVMYENGQGVEQDYNKAVEWYRKAAAQGNAMAQNNLGLTYYNGQGVEQDYNKAVEWYRKAAE